MSNHNISSDESTVSDSFVNLKSAFRVRVCLRHYFDDVRSRSYILVSRNRRVLWLQERLRKVFSLTGRFCLCANGHLLPPTEPLGLLCPEDRVEVIPLQDGQFQGQNVENALVISKEKGDAKANTPSALLSDGPDGDHNGVVHEPGHFKKCLKKNDHKIMNVEISTEDYVDGFVEPTEAESSEPNMESLDSCWDASVYTDVYTESSQHLNVLDDAHALQRYKQEALALLESRCGSEVRDDSAVSEVKMPKRTRRRVRRRVRRAAEAPPGNQAVARNDAKCARRPRLVQSLDTVNVHISDRI